MFTPWIYQRRVKEFSSEPIRRFILHVWKDNEWPNGASCFRTFYEYVKQQAPSEPLALHRLETLWNQFAADEGVPFVKLPCFEQQESMHRDGICHGKCSNPSWLREKEKNHTYDYLPPPPSLPPFLPSQSDCTSLSFKIHPRFKPWNTTLQEELTRACRQTDNPTLKTAVWKFDRFQCQTPRIQSMEMGMKMHMEIRMDNHPQEPFLCFSTSRLGDVDAMMQFVKVCAQLGHHVFDTRGFSFTKTFLDPNLFGSRKSENCGSLLLANYLLLIDRILPFPVRLLISEYTVLHHFECQSLLKQQSRKRKRQREEEDEQMATEFGDCKSRVLSPLVAGALPCFSPMVYSLIVEYVC